MVDEVPRLSCPDLAAAVVRWQHVWEGRDEAGACLGTMLPCCCLDRAPITQQYGNQAMRHKEPALRVHTHGLTRAMQ